MIGSIGGKNYKLSKSDKGVQYWNYKIRRYISAEIR